MAAEVVFDEDPGRVLLEAKAFLASDPVLHDLILTLLHARVAYPEPGRYWLAGDGEAAMAARFAGQWTERQGSAAFPVEGQRIYELARVPLVTPVDGRMRKASIDDRNLVLAWMRGFYADIGQEAESFEPIVERRPGAGYYWLWEDGGPASMAAHSEPVEGMVRVQAVYTPPERRNRGYAGACVADLSRRMLEEGYRCMLYTDLGNPTSNSVYRRIGYRAVAEGLRYRFGSPGSVTPFAS